MDPNEELLDMIHVRIINQYRTRLGDIEAEVIREIKKTFHKIILFQWRFIYNPPRKSEA